MKSKLFVFFIFVVVYSYSAQKGNSKINSYSLKDIEPVQSTEATSPISLLLPKSSFDVNFGNSLLAPIRGTELAVGITQSRLKTSGKFETGKSSGTSDMSVGSIYLAHAINENFFVGTNINYGQSKGDNEWTYAETGKTSYSTSKTSGVSDPTFTLGSQIRLEKTSLLFSVSAKVKTGDSEYKTLFEEDSSTSNSESNLKSGGNAVTPSIAIYTHSLAGMILGGLVSYSILSERISKDTDSDGHVSYTKSTGGNVQKASLFLETTKSYMSLGGSVDYTRLESGISKSSGSSYSYEYKNDALAFTTLTGFLSITLNNNFSVIPSLSYGRFGEGTSNLDDKDMYSANVLAKSSF